MQQPQQIIANAIQTGFVKYPLEDDLSVWDEQWIQPTESAHLAKAIILELAARGFEIVKKATNQTQTSIDLESNSSKR